MMKSIVLLLFRMPGPFERA